MEPDWALTDCVTIKKKVQMNTVSNFFILFEINFTLKKPNQVND
jgi:hypothetical protein